MPLSHHRRTVREPSYAYQLQGWARLPRAATPCRYLLLRFRRHLLMQHPYSCSGTLMLFKLYITGRLCPSIMLPLFMSHSIHLSQLRFILYISYVTFRRRHYSFNASRRNAGRTLGGRR